MDTSLYAPQHQEEIKKMVAFWLKFSQDTVFGGYFCALSSKGEIITSDKWIAWHGQQAYTFAQHYQATPDQPEWLAYARHGADFLLQFGADAKDNWRAVVDCSGHLVLPATDAQPEAWAAAAWSKLAVITAEEIYAEAAKKTLLKALKRREKTLQKWTEDITGPRRLKNLAEWSALATALLAAAELLGEKIFKEKATALLEELMTHFLEPRASLLLENVFPQGGYCDCPEGRKLNPGRIFEAINAGLELARLLKKRQIGQKLAKHAQYIAETTWDEKYGGFFQWLDLKTMPMINPAADHKLAWPQLAALKTLHKADVILNQPELFKLWQRTHDYIWQHFPDLSPTGEWVGLLSRHGEPLLDLKASPEKSAYQTLGWL